MAIVLDVQGLTKQYTKVLAANQVSFQIGEGEIFALIGPNGAGKTTTIRMLCCLTKPTEGDATLSGASIVREPMHVKEKIGVSPQETAVAANLTAEENLRLMCGMHGLSKAETDEKVRALSERFHLNEVLSRRAGKLSGGWQRRLSIAMALVSDPEILFLDEPTLGLDVIARSELWDVIRGMKGHATIILTTHYMEEAEALSDRVGVMKDGRLLALGTPDALKAQTGQEKFEDAFIAIVRGASK